DAAREVLGSALELDPTCIPVLSALRRFACELSDWAEAARLLDREQRHTATARARARLLVDLGEMRRDKLGDAHGAMHAFEEAHGLDAENDRAAWPVAEALVERCELSRAEPILERLTRAS